MTTKPDQFSEMHRKNMEAAMRLTQLSLDNSQRVMAVQAQLARELFTDGVANAKAQTEAGDPQEMLKLRSTYAQETARKMLAAAQQIAAVGNETRNQFAHLLTEQLAAGSHEMVDAFQDFFATLPGQNTNVMASVQQAMASANHAFEQVAKASADMFQQMNEIARGGTQKKT